MRSVGAREGLKPSKIFPLAPLSPQTSKQYNMYNRGESSRFWKGGVHGDLVVAGARL